MRFVPMIRCQALLPASLICEASWRGWGSRKGSQARIAFPAGSSNWHEQREQRFGGRSTGPCEPASRGVRGQRHCPLGGSGATRGTLGIQALLAGGGSRHCWIGMFGPAGGERARGRDAEKAFV